HRSGVMRRGGALQLCDLATLGSRPLASALCVRFSVVRPVPVVDLISGRPPTPPPRDRAPYACEGASPQLRAARDAQPPRPCAAFPGPSARGAPRPPRQLVLPGPAAREAGRMVHARGGRVRGPVRARGGYLVLTRQV